MVERVIDEETGREVELFNSDELKADRTAYWSISCDHSQKKLGRVAYRNGSLHVRTVCLVCGQFVGDTTKKLPEHDQLETINYERIAKEYRANRQKGWDEVLQKHARMQRRRSAGYQKEYLGYLASPVWRAVRDKVLQRANFVCEGCLERPATQVHHLSYRYFRREMMFDLVAVCRDCHAICHPDKIEDSDDLWLDDLPCFGCRHYGDITDDGSWCDRFDVHTVVALTDRERCGPKRQGFEELK